MTAAILQNNLVQGPLVTVTASGAVASAPVSNLLITPTQRRWQVDGTSGYILVDFGATVIIDTVDLEWVTGVNPTYQLRLSSVDATGVAGNIYNSTALTGLPRFDPDYGRLVFCLTQSYSFRYLRIDLSEAGVAAIGAGYLTAGLRDAFGINFQTPYSVVAARGSVDTFGVGGQTFVDLRQGHWKSSAQFSFVSLAEMNGFIRDIGVDIVNEGHKDMLWIEDPESDNLSRDCNFGYIEGDLVVTQDQYLVPPVFSVSVPIRQRL